VLAIGASGREGSYDPRPTFSSRLPDPGPPTAIRATPHEPYDPARVRRQPGCERILNGTKTGQASASGYGRRPSILRRAAVFAALCSSPGARLTGCYHSTTSCRAAVAEVGAAEVTVATLLSYGYTRPKSVARPLPRATSPPAAPDQKPRNLRLAGFVW